MPQGKITEAHAVGTRINISFKPKEGNIAGTININCPDGIIKTITPRPLTPLLATMVAKRLVGTEWDIPLFGQMSKEQRKKDLKRRGLWVDKDNKMEITWEDKKVDEKLGKIPYSEIWNNISLLKGVSREHGSWKQFFPKLSWEEYKKDQIKWLGIAKINGKLVTDEHNREERSCPHLVAVVKKLGERANGKHAELKIVSIPKGIDWEIDEYDGQESVEEKHRSWG